MHEVKSLTFYLSCTCYIRLEADSFIHQNLKHDNTSQFSQKLTHTTVTQLDSDSWAPWPKLPALLLVSIVMSVSLSSSGLKGWPDLMMWLLYWAWSAFLAPFAIQSSVSGPWLWAWLRNLVWSWAGTSVPQSFSSFRSSGLMETNEASGGAAAASQDLRVAASSPNPHKKDLSDERRGVTALWNVGFKCVKSCRIYRSADSD